jgi:hypothetical protein
MKLVTTTTLVLALLLSACSGGGQPPNNGNKPEREVASITLSPETATIPVGQTQTFTATAKDVSGATINTSVAWTSSDTHVATVMGGVATGLAQGTTHITASSNGVTSNTAELTVTIDDIDEESPPISNAIAYVRGDELRLIGFDGAGDRLVWKAPAVDPAKPELIYEVAAPAWRPDGREIAFSSEHEMALSIFQYDIYAIRPDGSNLRKLTNGPAYGHLASYPKGTVTVTVSNTAFNGGPFLVYVQGAPEPQQINLGVGSTIQLTFNGMADLGEGVFQPVVVIDGIQRWWDAAVAADVRSGTTTNAGHISLSAYPLERFGAHAPLWRVDGSRLGFIVTAFTFGNAACLLQQTSADPPPGPSYEFLLNPDVFGPICAVDWAPTAALADQLLVVDATSDYSETGETHIYRVTEESSTKGSPVVTFDRYVQLTDLRWLPDGSGFIVARQDDLIDEDINLYEFTFATRELRKITDFTGEFVRAFSLSPDGQSCLNASPAGAFTSWPRFHRTYGW